MSHDEYRMIAVGWLLLLLFLTLFWYFTLRKLSQVLTEHLKSTCSHQDIAGLRGLFLFLMRGEYRQTGDERLVAVCARLRQRLYGYLGAIGGYIVFLVIFRPRY
jgi:hypothetical protein